MGQRETYLEKRESELKVWDAVFKRLEAKADTARAEPTIPYFDHLRSLYILQKTVHESLREAKHVDADTWKSFKAGFENEWQALRGSLIDTIAIFQMPRNQT